MCTYTTTTTTTIVIYISQKCIPSPPAVISSNGPRFFTISTTIDITKPQHVTTIPLNGRQGLSIVDGKARVACWCLNFPQILSETSRPSPGHVLPPQWVSPARHAANIYIHFDREIFIYSQSFSVAPVPLEQHHASVYHPSDHPEHRCQQSVSSSTRRKHRNARFLVHVWNTTAFAPTLSRWRIRPYTSVWWPPFWVAEMYCSATHCSDWEIGANRIALRQR